MNKKTPLIIGILCCCFMLSGLPAYYISSFSRPVGQQAVFYYVWLFFSTPSGIVLLAWMIQWYKEKTYT